MTEWRIHLGAHKTATTHLQQTLAVLGLAPSLEEFREAFWRKPEERRILGRDLLEHRRWSSIPKFSDYRVVSDENILCEAHEACHGFDIDTIRRRLKKLASKVGRYDTQIFLAIRNPAEFSASIYSEALRHHPEAVNRDRTRTVWRVGGEWLRLAQAIAEQFPLTVWRYEDYREHRDAITSEVVGSTFVDALPKLPDPPQTKRLTAADVMAIEKQYGRIAAKQICDSKGKFVIFDAAETERLGRIYESEVLDISSIAKVLSFKP